MMWLWIVAAICLYAFIGGATFGVAKRLDLGPDYCTAGVVMWPLAWIALLLSLLFYLGMRLEYVLPAMIARRKQRP